MSIANEIQRLQTAKSDIKTAIEGKGVTVPSSALLSAYDDYIGNISGQSAYILVTSTAGATLTCGSQTYTLGESETEHAFSVGLGTYTVTASKNGNAVSDTVVVANYSAYHINLFTSRVPNTHQEVQWIRSVGEQFINTNYVGSANVYTKVKAEPTTLDPNYRTVVGARTSGEQDRYYFSATAVASYFASGTNEITLNPLSVYESYIIEITYRNAKINNIEVASTQATIISNRPIFVFARNAIDTKFIGKVYECEIVDGSSRMMLVPCYRKSDNEIGMYDTVTNTFFTNQGTGSFIAGPDVN